MNGEIPLKIILQTPPAGVYFGLQKGSGNNYETIQKQRSGTADLLFEFTITVKWNKDGSPNFLGVTPRPGFYRLLQYETNNH